MTYYVFAIIQTASWLIMGYAGYKVGKSKKEPTTKYVCSCKHNYNEHLKKGNGECIVTTVTTASDGKEKGRHKCPCLFYLGPKPDPSPEDIFKLFNQDNERDTQNNN